MVAETLGRSLDLPCGVSLQNRLAKASMTEGLADRRNRATDAHIRLYRRWSNGGAGLLLTGNIMVDRRFLERPGNIVLEDDRGLEALRRVVSAGTEGGNEFWAQLSHPGRQTQRWVAPEPVAPSAVKAVKTMKAFGKPRALEVDEIREIIERFRRSAELAQQAGFTGIEIHGAHGYLVSQFLSPLTNLREDEWGGSLENRARFLLEIVDAIRNQVGADFPLAVKLNSADFQRGGFTQEESMQVVRMLNDKKIDMLEISGGNYESTVFFEGVDDGKSESTRRREAFFIDYARKVREIAEMPLMMTGGFRSAGVMVDAIESNVLDVIGMARPIAFDPEFPDKLLSDISDEATAPRIPSPIPSLQGPFEAGWYYRQIERLGAGKDTDPDINRYWTTARYLIREFWQAKRRITN